MSSIKINHATRKDNFFAALCCNEVFDTIAEMKRRGIWCIRQNPRANTDQKQMRRFIISQKIVTCPFGHVGPERDNVINGVYNEEGCDWKSQSQDRKFIEDMKIGDIILITFAGLKDCILARIVSDPIYGVDTGLFTSMRDGKIQLTTEGDTPFTPVGRKIQIIRNDVRFKDKRILPRVSLYFI